MRKFILLLMLFSLISIFNKSIAQPPGVYVDFIAGIGPVEYANNHFIGSRTVGYLNIVSFDSSANVAFEKRYGSAILSGGIGTWEMDYVYRVTENNQQYLIWCGSTGLFGVPWNFNNVNYFIKTNMQGDTIWTHLYGGGRSAGFCLANDSNYIFAKLDGYGTIIKVDRNTGDTLWTKKNIRTIGLYDRLMVHNVIYNYQNAFYTFGVTYPVSNAAFMQMKTDTLGTAQWVKAYGDTTANLCWGTTQCNDGGFLLVGQSAPDDFNVDTLWYHDFLVIRTDINGDTLWCKRYDNNLQVDKASCAVATDDGGFVILGTTQSWTPGATSIESSTLLLKIDSVGNPVWANTYYNNGALLPAAYFQIRETANKGFIWSNGLVQVTDSMGINCLAVPTTVTVGYPQITITNLTVTNEQGLDFCYSPPTQEFTPFGDITDYCNYLPVSSITKQEEIKIYPNPANEKLAVTTLSQKNKCTVSLRNVFGEIIYKEEVVLNTIEINTSNIKAGIYFLTVKDAVGNSESKKVVVVH